MPRMSPRIANCSKEGLQEYKYTPLQNAGEWIRLFRFLPKHAGASFCAQILHVKLCDAPPYRALSYTWGDSSDIHADIELCTELDLPMTTTSTGEVPGVFALFFHCSHTRYFQRQRFPIRPNLEAAMQRLESLYGNWYIWIDAICIDQSNNFEKGHQVSIMSHIYRRAMAIDIWLGEEDQESDLAMDLITEYENTCGCKADDEDSMFDLYQREEAFQNKTRDWTSHWRALEKLISRTWFKRRWIIQETAFKEHAKYVLCGSKRVCWCEFYCVVSNYHGNHCDNAVTYDFHENFSQIQSLTWVSKKMKQGEKDSLTLEALLGKFHRSSCTDSRDAVYSLISLATDIDLKEWLPDYSYETSELSLFQKTFQHIVYTSKSLDVMCRSKKRQGGVVSWLPRFGYSFQCGCGRPSCISHGHRNFSLTTFGRLQSEYQFENSSGDLVRIYSASGSTIPKIRISMDRSTLHVDGYRVDTIKSMPSGDKSRCRSCKKAILPDRWMRAVCEMNLKSGGVGKVSEAYLRSLVGNRAVIKVGLLEKLPDAWLSILEEAAGFHDTCGCDVNEEARRIIRTMETLRDNLSWAFAITERSLGFVPTSAVEGDTVCILLGCSVPVVLRNVGDSMFIFIGECYIDGLMEAEFMHLASENAWEPEEIKIR